MITLDIDIQERNISVLFQFHQVDFMLGCLLLRKSRNLEAVSLLTNKDIGKSQWKVLLKMQRFETGLTQRVSMEDGSS